jgi:Protein of unknown function (DUF1488)
MPLERASGLPSVRIDAIYFPMKDSETGATLVCRVTHDFLRVRKGAQGDEYAMLGVFERFRSEIEAIASDKYDSKQACDITADD